VAFIERAAIGRATVSCQQTPAQCVLGNQCYSSTLLLCSEPNSADIPGTFFDNLIAYYIQMQPDVGMTEWVSRLLLQCRLLPLSRSSFWWLFYYLYP